MVKTWGITRDEQDQLALESHQKAAAAYASGFYKDLVSEYLGVARTTTSAAILLWRNWRSSSLYSISPEPVR